MIKAIAVNDTASTASNHHGPQTALKAPPIAGPTMEAEVHAVETAALNFAVPSPYIFGMATKVAVRANMSRLPRRKAPSTRTQKGVCQGPISSAIAATTSA